MTRQQAIDEEVRRVYRNMPEVVGSLVTANGIVYGITEAVVAMLVWQEFRQIMQIVNDPRGSL